jgi:predicted enzyme related to lactoylglutathione lyase
MISNSKVMPTLPVVDLERAKKFYRDTLGLKISGEDQAGVLFEGGGSNLYLYKRAPTKADHTVASFEVDDVRKEVDGLRRKGVKFEEYDIPEMGLKTVDGIATMRSDQYETLSAWFKDTEGNILALVNMTPVRELQTKR